LPWRQVLLVGTCAALGGFLGGLWLTTESDSAPASLPATTEPVTKPIAAVGDAVPSLKLDDHLPDLVAPEQVPTTSPASGQ
jgi:hypothetical protein